MIGWFTLMVGWSVQAHRMMSYSCRLLSWHTMVGLYSSAPRLNYHLTNCGFKPQYQMTSKPLSFRDETWGQMDMHVLICIFYVQCAKNTQKWITMLWRLKLLVTLFSGLKHCSASYFRNSLNLSLQNSTSCLHMSIFFCQGV